MSKYVYPAIFTSEPDGGYSVYFPDLEGCYTCGDTLADALFMAEDALALILYGYEKDQNVRHQSYCGFLFKYGCMRYPGISQTF